MKYISICSGIESATVAFHPLGWKPLAFAEIEAFPSAVLAHHYPHVPNLGDMTRYREWPEELLAECELLVGGPPCQAFSIAGQRRSLDDERGNLTLTYVNLIDHIDTIRRKHGRDPIAALYENVPGIYSTRDNAFGCLVGAICGQDAPVETETGKWPTAGILWGEKRRVGYRTLDAQFFGLAQRRRRCFLLAVPNELVERVGDRACPSEILSIAESLRGDSPPRREAGEKPAPTISAHTKGGGGLGTDFELDGGLIAHSLRADGFDASEDGTGRGTPLVPVAIQERAICENSDAGPDGAGFRTDGVSYTLEARTTPQAVAFSCKDYGVDASEISPTLRAMGYDKSHANAGGQLAVAIPINMQAAAKNGAKSPNMVGVGIDGDPSPTLNTNDRHAVAVAFDLRGCEGGAMLEGPHDTANIRAASGGSSRSYVAGPMQVRRLTVEECEALQGFPRGYTAITYRNKPAADGPRYKAIGNAMATPCMFWIGWRIDRALRQRMAA